jgi:hypothetical protein
VLSCGWPVEVVRRRFEAEADATWDEPPPLAEGPTQIRVWRRDERVLYRAISPLEAELLRAAAAGESFGAICERAAVALGEAQAAVRAAALLGSWLEAGLLARLAHPDARAPRR